LQARHRDRLEDALDHLDSLRKNARDRQSDIAAIGTSSSDVGLNVSSISDSDISAASSLIPNSDLNPDQVLDPDTASAPEPFSPADLATYRLPVLDLLRPATAAEQELVPPEEDAANKDSRHNDH
jgi:S-DNA-T family DNA segregation ATPase FtsK/SpoIIIE